MKNKRIDYSRCDTCNGAFLCTKDCVTSYIQVVGEDNETKVSFKDRGLCINCGHCYAICPQKAVIFENINVDDNEFLQFLSSKRTVRQYNKSRSISSEDLDIIIRAGQSAPSEKNKPTVRICMIKDVLEEVFIEALEVLKKKVDTVGSLHPQYRYISELYKNKRPVFWGAEYAVVIIGKPAFAVDAALVAERMQLMAQSLGISSGYNGNLSQAINESNKLKSMIGIKETESSLVSFALGYSDVEYISPYLEGRRVIMYL